MGQPTPPGDVPLYEGLGSEWNDIVGAFPEDKRAELAPKLKERISSYEVLEPWKDFHSKGIKPEQVNNALNLYNFIETNPRDVYEAIGQSLNITPAQAEKVVEQLEDADQDDPRIAALQQQVETLAQITLAERQQSTQQKLAAEQDAKIEAEINAVKQKYGDIDEEEILMRMAHKDISADEAAQEYLGKVSEIQKRRPAPFVLGGGGTVPNKQIDPTKLSSADTKSVVAQMMEHATRNK
jgi:hypothetical protein